MGDTEGLTLNVLLPVVAPVLQVYEAFDKLVDEAVRITFPPAHTVELLAVRVSVGCGFTVTVTVLVTVHPLASLPFTV